MLRIHSWLCPGIHIGYGNVSISYSQGLNSGQPYVGQMSYLLYGSGPFWREFGIFLYFLTTKFFLLLETNLLFALKPVLTVLLVIIHLLFSSFFFPIWQRKVGLNHTKGYPEVSLSSVLGIILSRVYHKQDKFLTLRTSSLITPTIPFLIGVIAATFSYK